MSEPTGPDVVASAFAAAQASFDADAAAQAGDAALLDTLVASSLPAATPPAAPPSPGWSSGSGGLPSLSNLGGVVFIAAVTVGALAVARDDPSPSTEPASASPSVAPRHEPHTAEEEREKSLKNEPEVLVMPDTHAPEPLPLDAEQPSTPERSTKPARGDNARRPSRRPPTAPALTPAELLRAANAARDKRAHDRAVDLYDALEGRFPRSREAGVARVSAAKLHAELGHHRRARTLYRAYLRHQPKGNLAEEALWGSAKASRALADTEAERRACEDLLGRFPTSLRASAARSRLQSLDRTP